MLARGAFISALCILFLLPALLTAFEPLLNKTSLNWRVPKPPKEKKPGRFQRKPAPAQGPLPQEQPEEIEKKGDLVR